MRTEFPGGRKGDVPDKRSSIGPTATSSKRLRTASGNSHLRCRRRQASDWRVSDGPESVPRLARPSGMCLDEPSCSRRSLCTVARAIAW